MREIVSIEQPFWRWAATVRGEIPEAAREFRWMLEECRVALFAQELKTPGPVSVKRLQKSWLTIQSGL